MEGVLAHQLVGKLGVAFMQSIDDSRMIDHRDFGTAFIADGMGTDPAHVNEQRLSLHFEHVAMSESDNRLMELNVGLGVFIDLRVGLFAVFERREARSESIQLGVGGSMGGKPCRHTLQGRPDVDDFDDLSL